jgi:hypothetical protein
MPRDVFPHWVFPGNRIVEREGGDIWLIQAIEMRDYGIHVQLLPTSGPTPGVWYPIEWVINHYFYREATSGNEEDFPTVPAPDLYDLALRGILNVMQVTQTHLVSVQSNIEARLAIGDGEIPPHGTVVMRSPGWDFGNIVAIAEGQQDVAIGDRDPTPYYVRQIAFNNDMRLILEPSSQAIDDWDEAWDAEFREESAPPSSMNFEDIGPIPVPIYQFDTPVWARPGVVMTETATGQAYLIEEMWYASLELEPLLRLRNPQTNTMTIESGRFLLGCEPTGFGTPDGERAFADPEITAGDLTVFTSTFLDRQKIASDEVAVEPDTEPVSAWTRLRLRAVGD